MIKLTTFNITVGPMEEAQLHASSYDAIINVADSPLFPIAPQCYWYPISELGNWGYSPFYWSKVILDRLTKEQKMILIHCHSGVNRSPSILVGWLYSLGYSKETIDQMIGDSWYTLKFRRNQDQNSIPNDMMEFYKLMKTYPSYSMMGILGMMNKPYAH